MTPEQEGFAVREVGSWDISSEGIAEAGVFVPVADVWRPGRERRDPTQLRTFGNYSKLEHHERVI